MSNVLFAIPSLIPICTFVNAFCLFTIHGHFLSVFCSSLHTFPLQSFSFFLSLSLSLSLSILNTILYSLCLFHISFCISLQSFYSCVFPSSDSFWIQFFSHCVCFLNGPSSASFCLFSVFSNKQLKFYNKLMWKNVHLVSAARIRTHNLLIMSLLL